MTLLITVVSAVICTVIWYRNTPHDVMKISDLCFMYWGASLMWFADAVYEYWDTAIFPLWIRPAKVSGNF